MPLLDEHQVCQPAATPTEFSGPDAPTHYPPDLEIEPRHLDVELHVDLEGQKAEGSVVTTVVSRRSGPRTLKLHAVDLLELSARDVDGRPLSYHYDGETLSVVWEEPFASGEDRKLALSYRVVKPASGLFFSKPTDAYPDAPWFAATDHETERARHWLPCVDLPSVRTTLELRLRANSRFTVLANGKLLEETDHGDGTKTACWRLEQRCPSYLVCFAIGDFVRYDDGEFQGIPVAYFATRRFTPEHLQRTFGRTKDMLAWMTDKLALPFPFPKYYQFALPGFGGAMENISLVSWDDIFVLDERLAEEWGWLVDQVNVHEMAHSYFGDLVVIRDFAHAWLKESWATYMEQCWLEHRYGEDEKLCDFHRNAQAYFTEADERYRRPIVTRQFKSSWQMYDRHLYPGGACRLHTLRCLLGDETFWTAVRDYLGRHAGQVVETDDFRRVLEEHSGRSLGKLFDQWFFTPGYPALKVTFSYDEEKKAGTFEVEQTQVDKEKGVPAFDLSTELGWVSEGELQVLPVEVRQPRQTFTIPMAVRPEQVRFDPRCKMLHKLDFNPGDPMLKKQLTDAPDVIGRILAARELVKSGKRGNIEAVAAAYRTERFWGVREQMAKALGDAGLEPAVEAIHEMIREEQDPRVLEAVMRAAGKYRDRRIGEAVLGRLQIGLPYRASQAAYEALGAQRQDAPWAVLREAAERADWSGFGQSGALRGLAATRRREALDMLLAKVGYGCLPQRARPAAVGALADIGTVQEKPGREPVVEQLLDLLRDPEPRVRKAAANGLKTVEAREATGQLERYRRSLSVQEQVEVDRILQTLRAEKPPRQAALQKQLEELQEKHRKLEDRVQKLESEEKTPWA